MRGMARGAIAALVLIAWALPCHDAEAKKKLAQDAAADSIQARKSVDEGNANFVRAWMAGNAALFADCFAEDGALFRGGGVVVLGRNAIRERMRSAFRRYRMTRGTITTTGLWLTGGFAYETGRWNFTIGPVDNPAEAAPDSGYFVEIWKKEGGAWKMWRDIGVPR